MILVDFSGTIAKHREAVDALFEEVDLPFFREHGFTGNKDELKKAFSEVNRKIRETETRLGDFTSEAAKMLKLTVNREDAVKKEELFDRRYIEIIEPVEGSVEAIKKLMKTDNLVLLTNSACRRVIPIVERFGLDDIFSQIICLGGTGKNKSQGDLFAKMRGMGAWAIVGDNPRKDGSAENFGITFIDVRVGWETAINLINGLKEEKLRMRV
jgi:FMN phosphatase YigB (HAD superfamily)